MNPHSTQLFLVGQSVVLASLMFCVFHAAAQTQPGPYVQDAQPDAETSSPLEQLLNEAQAFLDADRFDLADKRYRQVLALDPENEAASTGRSEVKDARARFEKELAERPRSTPRAEAAPEQSTTADTVTIKRKLQSITIPNFEVYDMSLDDVLELLRKQARIYDTDPDSNERGLNIFLKLPRPPAPSETAAFLRPGSKQTVTLENSSSESFTAPIAPTGSTKITVTLSHASPMQVLNYVAAQAGLKVKVEPYAVSLVPLTEVTEEMFTAETLVPPSFFGTGPDALVPPTTDLLGSSAPFLGRFDAKKFLESCGVTFPPGSSAVYLPSKQKLIIRNTQANLDLVGALRDDLNSSPQPANAP